MLDFSPNAVKVKDGKGWVEFAGQVRKGTIKVGDYADVNGRCYRILGPRQLNSYTIESEDAKDVIGDGEWHSFRYEWESTETMPAEF